MPKVKGNIIQDIFESKARDRESIAKASHKIDAIRIKYGKAEKGFNSTEILRKIREGNLR